MSLEHSKIQHFLSVFLFWFTFGAFRANVVIRVANVVSLKQYQYDFMAMIL